MSQSRELAAIMFTDIVGYTSLMGSNETKAFEILKSNRELQKSVVHKFNGRWIKELGDGVMASFKTVSDAVGAAIDIQRDCNVSQEYKLRIGIHLGEVVFENGDVFGDGVNIASRIQAFAKPGSIYVSESVHHNMANKKLAHTTFIAEEKLKNVREPLKIYEATMWGALSVPVPLHISDQRPNSIAVLPFANMSSDPEQEYFSDGLTEEIINDLSKVSKLLVISRSSVMTLKGTHKKMKEIAGEMNVQYVLEGSVRKAGNNLRITAQLIDALNDVHLWSEKYNGSIDDVFDIQEKVSRSIVDALSVQLTPRELQQITDRPINNIHAYECYLKARQELLRGNKESMENALRLVQNGLDLVGPNDLLYATLGYAHYFYYRLIDKADITSLQKVRDCVVRTFEINPQSCLGHVLAGWVHWLEGDLQACCKSMRMALDIEPTNYDALFGLSETYIYAGKSSTTYDLGEKLIQIDPLTPMTHIMRGTFYIGEEFTKGIPYFEKAWSMDPQSPLTQWMLASAYFWVGRNEDAFPLVDSLASLLPDWSFTKQLLFLTLGLQGKKQDALLFATKELTAEAQDDRHFAFHLAECYAVIDEKSTALDLLEHSMEIFFPYQFLSKDLLFKNLFDEPRFKDLMSEGKKRSEAFKI